MTRAILTAALLLTAVLACAGCNVPQEPKTHQKNDRLTVTYLGTAGLSTIYECEIDGDLYIVCGRGHGGTAICPKVKPAEVSP